MKKLAIVAAGIAAVPMLAMSSTVFADSPGQLMGGSALYQVKNLTQNGSYASSANATCNDEVQYSIEIHNTEFGALSNIAVQASLPNTATSVSSVTASATTSAGKSVSVNGNVTVTTGANQTIAYEAGSTTLYDGNGKMVKTLADGITTTGVNLGGLPGSTGEFVNFKAKVSCTPTPTCQPGQTGTYPNCTNPTCTHGQTGTYPNCVTPPTTTTPVTTLPNTGAGNVVAIAIGAIVAGTVAGRLFLSRKLARKV